MGKHWVQAIKAFRLPDGGGRSVLYQPGDWLEVTRHIMRQLQEQGNIQVAPQVERDAYNLDDCGVLLWPCDGEPTLPVDYKLPIECSALPALPFNRTMLWRAGSPISLSQTVLGLAAIEDIGEYNSWEVAAKLKKDILAEKLGSPEERQKTLELLGDLRLPAYDVSSVWVRKTPSTEAMMAVWLADLEQGADPAHAFLRAIYTSRVILCSLQSNWMGR